MDRLTSMAVFVAAADEGSLSGAARRFGLSVSMAGKHVAAIEAELNIRLMHRTTRKLRLTDVGRAYYARCKRILEDYEDANREAADAQQSIRGLLRVAAPVTFGAMHLGDVASRFLVQHPDVTLEIALDDRYVDLLAEGIDVAIRIGQLSDSDLVARRLAECRMVLCASPEFIERHGLISSIEDLRRAPRLTFSDAVSAGDWTVTDPDGQAHVIDGPVVMAANNTQMLLAAAIAGAGISYGPSFVFGQSITAGDLVPLTPQYTAADLAIQAVYPSRRHLSLKVRRFLDHLVESFGGTPPWDEVLTV